MSYEVECEEIAYGVFEFKPVKKEQTGSDDRPNLSIISKTLKRKYDAMDKPYTWGDVAKATGMWTDAPLHSPYKFLTERQYREIVRTMKEIQKMSGKQGKRGKRKND